MPKNLLVKTVYAQSPAPGDSGIDLGEQLKLKSGKTVKEAYDTPGKLVNLITSNLFVIAGVIVFLMIIGAGFMFISSDSAKGKDDSSRIITGAVVGFIVMFSAYWIVQIIQKITGADILF